MDGFAGHEILETLGARRGASIFRVRKGEGPTRILKVLDRDLWSPEGLAQYQEDLEVLRGLSHPRMARFLEAGLEDGDHWYTVEDGGSRILGRHIEERVAAAGGLAPGELMRITAGLTEVLAYLHAEGVVHGDLDPSNLFLDGQGELRVSEFHLGRARGGEEQDTTRLRYASPEQVQGDAQDPRSDVYQVGMVLYHAATGKLPREDENPFQTMLRRQQEPIPAPSKQNPHLSEALDRMIMKCLQFSPGERYPTMEAFAQELARLDPSSGELRRGKSMPGMERSGEVNALDGLYIPKDAQPKRSAWKQVGLWVGAVLLVMAAAVGTVLLLP